MGFDAARTRSTAAWAIRTPAADPAARRQVEERRRELEFGGRARHHDLHPTSRWTGGNTDIVLVATENGLFVRPTRAPVLAVRRSRLFRVEHRAQQCRPARLRAAVSGAARQPHQRDLQHQPHAVPLHRQGATWAPISNAGGVFANSGRTTLAVARSRAGRCVRVLEQHQRDRAQDVYRSSDGGQTWVANRGCSGCRQSVPGSTNQPTMNICGSAGTTSRSAWTERPESATRSGSATSRRRARATAAGWTLRTWWLYSQSPRCLTRTPTITYFKRSRPRRRASCSATTAAS